MSNITLEGIAEVVKVELEPVKTELAEVKTIVTRHTEILDNHSAALEAMLKQKKNKEDEAAIAAHRFERQERWAQKVGENLGIKLEL